jgi:tetratricopeptide (TPR) repeat protein
LVQLGRREEAVSAYTSAWLEAGDPVLLYGRGNALSILKRYDEAIRDCEAVLARDPDYPTRAACSSNPSCKLAIGRFRRAGRKDFRGVAQASASSRRSI